MLGEEHQLLARRRGRARDRAGAVGDRGLRDAIGEGRAGEDLAEQARQFPPLGVGAAATHAEREHFEPRQRLDLDLQLGDRARRGGLVEHLFFERLDFVVRRFVKVFDIFGVECWQRCGQHGRRLAAALQHFKFTQAALETLASAAQ